MLRARSAMQEKKILRGSGVSCAKGRGFFCLDAAWLNEGRCPGGRPSVS